MIRRLILRLDPRTTERSELAAYVALAQALDAELLAQLVEDERLNELASLPFVTEVCRSSARSRPLNPESLQRRSERLLRQLRDELEEIARRSPLHWELVRIDRAQTPVQIPAADTALLRAARPSSRHQSAAASPANKPHIAVIHGGDDASERALSYARRISEHQQIPILLLALPDSPWHRAHTLPEGVGVRTDLAGYEPSTLRPMLRAWHVILLLVPADSVPTAVAQENLTEQLPDVALLVTP